MLASRGYHRLLDLLKEQVFFEECSSADAPVAFRWPVTEIQLQTSPESKHVNSELKIGYESFDGYTYCLLSAIRIFTL